MTEKEQGEIQEITAKLENSGTYTCRMYGITGFIESARIGSNQASTGLNYECDAIAACIIGGVSFVGGTGKISGVGLIGFGLIAGYRNIKADRADHREDEK